MATSAHVNQDTTAILVEQVHKHMSDYGHNFAGFFCTRNKNVNMAIHVMLTISDINECSSNPCLINGVVCNDQVNSYECACAPGYSLDTASGTVHETCFIHMFLNF